MVVLDVDEAPQDMMLSSTIVEENSPVKDTKIGKMTELSVCQASSIKVVVLDADEAPHGLINHCRRKKPN